MKLNYLFLLLLPLTFYSNDKFKGWEKVNTEHFSIIFEPKDKESAFEIVDFAEDVYDNITTFIGNYPKNIKVVLHSRIDTANGSYYPVPEHINIYLTSPTNFFLGSKTENWLKSCFIHELTHYIHMSYENGWLWELSKFFGPVLKPGSSVFSPGWMVEGITTYSETKFTNGGRGRNPFFEIYYKAPILENKFPTLKQSRYSSFFQPYSRIYVIGYMFIEYLINNYGDDFFKKLQLEISKNPFAPIKNIEKITGKSAYELYDDMLKQYSENYSKYYKIKDGTIFTKHGNHSYYRPIKNKDSILSYKQQIEEKSGFVEINIKTGIEKKIYDLSISDDYSYCTNKDFSKIYFSSFDINFAHEVDTIYKSDLFVLDKKSKKIKRLTFNQHILHPTLSDDEKYIVAIQLNKQYSRLVKIKLDTFEVTTIFEKPKTTVYLPTISPDGKIAFVINENGYQDIALLVDNKLSYITGQDKHGEYFPTFIDNNRLLFSSDRYGDIQLFEYNFLNEKFYSVIQDRILAYTGFYYDNKIYYGSYSSNGWNVKYKSFVLKELESFKSTETVKNDEAITNNYETKKYLPIAQFVGWTPIPIYYTSLNSSEAPFGLGFLLYAQSIIKNDYVFVTLSNPFTVFNPGGQIIAGFEIDILDFQYKLTQGYLSFYDEKNVKNFKQLTNQFFSVNIAAYKKNILGKNYNLNLGAGLTHQYTISNIVPFHFFDLPNFNLSTFKTEHFIQTSLGISFSYSEPKASAFSYSNANVFTSLQTAIMLPVLTNKDTKVLTVIDIGGNIPTYKNQSLMLQAIIEGVNYKRNFNLGVKGFTNTNVEAKVGSSIFIGYQFPIAVIDTPLFAGFSLHSFSANVWTSFTTLFATQNKLFEFGDYVYLGAELNTIVGFSLALFPVKVGVSARISTKGETFNITSDIKPYFDINIGSILSTLKNVDNERMTTYDELNI